MYAPAQATFATDSFAIALFGFGRPAPASVRPPDLEPYRATLTKYARRWLRSDADVEDVVQETFATALSSPQGFAGRSTPKTWLQGILEHKIVDTYRRQSREPVAEAPAEQDEIDALFTPDGQWRTAPTNWGDPEAALDRREFHEMLDDCLACLPRNCARAFKLREMMELEFSEICDVLGISIDNCCVMLHRARMQLRTLVEQRWFASPPPVQC